MSAFTTEKMLATLRQQNALLERIAAALEEQVALAHLAHNERLNIIETVEGDDEYSRILGDNGRCERGECEYCKTMEKFDAGEDCYRARCGKDDCRSCAGTIDDLTPDAQRHYLNDAIDKDD
jgi:hypothetical protein